MADLLGLISTLTINNDFWSHADAAAATVVAMSSEHRLYAKKVRATSV